MRSDKKKNIAKVAKSLVENPLQTEREVAESLWINHATVNRAKQELQQIAPKDDRIVWITDKDLQNIILMQQVVTAKIQDTEEMSKTRIGELAQAMREATARYSLFAWNATDEKGALKWITNIIIE